MTQLTLSTDTQLILKNFSGINSSILVREGNQLKTISVGENMIAQYECGEMFPQTFGIYDLPQFLSGLSLFGDSPSLVFDNTDYVTISGNGRKCKYFFSDPEITIKSAPDRDVKFPGSDITFVITHGSFKALLDASGVYQLPDLKISSTGNSITLSLCDKENDTTNSYEEVIDGKSTGDFENFYVKVESLRLYYDLKNNKKETPLYEVSISSQLISQWKHVSLPLTYYIALEP